MTYSTNQNQGPSLLTIIIVIAIGWLVWQNLDLDWGNGDDHNHDHADDPEGVWEAVAVLVEEGDPEDSHELAALILQLKEVGLIGEDEVDAFNDEFPGLAEEFRELDDDDAEKIRSLQ